MTPQERQLIDELFDRLARVEGGPQDREAVDAIANGLRRAPNALYTLVQTVLLQEQALNQAHERINELERAPAQPQAQGGGFLDSMRNNIFGQGRGSVPSVQPSSRPSWNTGDVLGQQATQDGRGAFGGAPQAPQQQPPQAGGRAGSFLGTAAAAAAGVVGGSLLMNSLRGMMGSEGDKQGIADTASADGGSKSPWSSDSSNNSLANDAGVNDVANAGGGERSGFFDQASYDDSDDYDDYDMDDGFDDV